MADLNRSAKMKVLPIAIAIFAAGCVAAVSPQTLVGEYVSADGAGDITLMQSGTFAVTDGSREVSLLLMGGRWRLEGRKLVLTWHIWMQHTIEEEAATYAVLADGDSIVFELSEAQRLPEDPARMPAQVRIGRSYSKRVPNQPLQRNAGSRPSLGDASASETPSSPGPRG